MARERIVEALKAGGALVCDGAWGTELQRRGLKPGECPELWCVERAADVLDIAKEYVAAGADLIETNSFGGSSLKLAHYGLAERAFELNEAAARLSREAAGESVWVLGSIGPSGKLLLMDEVAEDELYRAFSEQARALEAGGADAILIETMSDIEEASIAIRAVKQNTRLEALCSFTFDRTVSGEYRTMFGVSPAQALLAALEAGADVVGANCGNGSDEMTEVVRQLRAADAAVPILVQPNAGLPAQVDGRDVFPETPEHMARAALELRAAGAGIIGGCCGSTPAHIKAIKGSLSPSFP